VTNPQGLVCFACGEVNTPGSRFCKFCGRALVEERQRPTVAGDPRNRLLLWLVLILLVALAVFFMFGLLTSKVFR
jgi:predicted nucleic acid-binding Zn ribbon protein